MQLLLRKLSTDSSGFQEYIDTELAADQVLLGSSPRSDIQLLDAGIAPTHLRFYQQGGRVVAVAEKGCKLIVNGQATARAELTTGDELQLGAQTFLVAQAPAGFDCALEWQAVDIPGHLLGNAYRTSIDQLRFSPRKVSWALAILVLVLMGLLPVLDHGFFNEQAADTEQVSHALRPTSLWSTGPLLPAHQVTIGNNCAVCHQSGFEQVTDQACQQCHSTVPDHLPATHPEVAEFEKFDCQNCHKEHNQPQSLVAHSDGLCVACHADLEPRVTGFSEAAHPPFAVTLLRPDVPEGRGQLNVTWQSGKFDPAAEVAAEETNHLVFPHDVHLDAESVTHEQRGDALQCADCHQLSSDREHFEPITMERQCVSCHDLSFDRSNPRKQLPHGSPADVYAALEAYYIGQAFGPELGAAVERRRLPARTREDDSCEEDYDCAVAKAEREAQQQFSQRGCVTCHEVMERPEAEGSDRWEVLPVQLNDDWHRAARFDHQSHLTQAQQEGDALCLSCHRADTSDTSADILMPTLDTCTSCHQGQRSAGRVALNCIDCHAYHDGAAASILPRWPEVHHQLMQGVEDGEL